MFTRVMLSNLAHNRFVHKGLQSALYNHSVVHAQERLFFFEKDIEVIVEKVNRFVNTFALQNLLFGVKVTHE